jgi:pimeloyl-ACP methyl ester carboxylesterase
MQYSSKGRITMRHHFRVAAIAAFALALMNVMPAYAEGAWTESGLWFEVTGEGPAVLLLHGSNLDHESFDQIATALAANHRVINTDLRFHGQSRDPGGPISFVRDVVEVLDAANAPRATLIGHSMGASIAVDVALAHPDRVDRLVLLAPTISGFSPTTRPEGLDAFIAALRAGDFDTAGAELAKTPVMQLHSATDKQDFATRMILRNLQLFRTDPNRVERASPAAERLGELTMPVTVVVGAQDASGALEVVDLVASKLNAAKVVRVAECGHLVVVDCAAEVVRAVGE